MNALTIIKKPFTIFCFTFFVNNLYSQSSINSGSLVAPGTMVSVGEIVVNPVFTPAGGTGIIGILSKVAAETLEIPQFHVAKDVIVYPNPTESQVSFQSPVSLLSEEIKVFNELGQFIKEVKINSIS